MYEYIYLLTYLFVRSHSSVERMGLFKIYSFISMRWIEALPPLFER